MAIDILPPPLKRGGQIYGFLCSGLPLEKIAKITGLSYPSVRKKAQKYERAGLIERTNYYPALYRKKKDFTPPLKPVGDFTPPLLLPHKFGATFALVGRPALQYDKWGKAHVREPSHLAQFGRGRAQIWLKHFRGSTTDEILNNGKTDLLALADAYSTKYGITLAIVRFYPDIEWLLCDEPASLGIAKFCGLPPQKELAGSIFKYSDASHPDILEINKAPQGAPERPTEHAKTMEYLLLHAPALLKRITEAVESIDTRLKHIENMEVR